MSNTGARIIEGLKEAAAGEMSRITIEGQVWQRMPAWQPIETAPRQTKVLVALWEYDNPLSGERVFLIAQKIAAGWVDDFEYGVYEPTHWMSLPEPPK